MGSIFHFYVMLLIIAYAGTFLHEANSACRFAVLSAPFQFAPFFFSYSQLAQTCINNVLTYFYLQVHKSEDLQSQKVRRKLCCSVCTIQVPCALITIATGTFILPMFLVTFWAFGAYFHIVMATFAALLPVYCIFTMLAYGFIYGRSLSTEEREKLIGKMNYPGFVLGLQLLPLFTLVSLSGFLMYYTGDWKLFHNAFFDGLTDPQLNWPHIIIFSNWDYLMEVLDDFFTFDVSIHMADLFALVLAVQTALIILKIGTVICKKSIRKCMQKATKQGEPDAQ